METFEISIYIYVFIGFIVSVIYQKSHNIKQKSNSIFSIVGSLIGVTFIIIIWPIAIWRI